jgi:2-keto-4-pentenoate hydratase
MLAEHAAEAARLLCEARASARPLAELPASCRPDSDADAYRIQDAVIARLGEAVGGWKIGVASETAPAFCAPILAHMIRPSPAAYRAEELRLIGIEGELALRLGRDLPPRDKPYDRTEVIEGATLHPAVEIVDSRFPDPPCSSGRSCLPTITEMAGSSTAPRSRIGRRATSPRHR